MDAFTYSSDETEVYAALKALVNKMTAEQIMQAKAFSKKVMQGMLAALEFD